MCIKTKVYFVSILKFLLIFFYYLQPGVGTFNLAFQFLLQLMDGDYTQESFYAESAEFTCFINEQFHLNGFKLKHSRTNSYK